MSDSSLVLVRERSDSAVAVALVAALLDDLNARYGFPDPDAPEPSELAPPDGTFVVAVVDGVPIGCGGLRRHADRIGEVKRMYVAPQARRRGIARAILLELHGEAERLGYERLRLETGIRQPEAIALYLSEGYEPIAPYGPYHRNHEQSRCFERLFRPVQGTSS